jgi:hypothetical protein
MTEWYSKHTKKDLSDRIDELTAMLSTVSELWAKEATEKNVLAGRCENLKAKLAKAVEALHYMVNHAGQLESNHGIYWEATEIARATLAELKGEQL